MKRSTALMCTAGFGLLLGGSGPALAGKSTTSHSAPASSAHSAPAAAPRTSGGASGGHPLSGGAAGGGGAAHGSAGGGAHALSNIAPPSAGGAHALSNTAPPGARGAHPLNQGGHAMAGSGQAARPEGAHADPRQGDRGESGRHAEEPHREAERPRLAPHVKLAGAVVGGAVVGAVAAHSIMQHREEAARNFGPGHDAQRDRDFVHGHEHDFHSRSVREFNEHELARWRGGLWHQDWRYGRWGWWYGVDDVWYPYDAPIYPYPVEVSEIVVPDGVVVADGPGEIVAPADVAPGAPPYVPGPVAIAVTAPSGTEIIVNPLPAAPPVAYRCATPVGVYPAVRLCPDVWSVEVP